MQNVKAAGPDGIPAEALKANPTASAEMLYPLMCNIWQQQQVLTNWKLWYLMKLPKKGDLFQCSTWRGITLLSTLSKVLARVVLERLKDAVDKQLRPQQLVSGKINHVPTILPH